MSRVIYVCSPYAGDVEQNTKNAIEYCQRVIRCGRTPLAPHLLYPQMLDDSNHIERRLGLKMALELLGLCDAVWVFGNHLSEGMRGEIYRAGQLGKILQYFTEGNPSVEMAISDVYYQGTMEGEVSE